MSAYAADVFEGFDITPEEIDEFRANHIGFSGVDMERVSEFFLIQLASIRKHRTYNSFVITDVIQDLEGVGRGCKRRVDQFKNLPLKGIWKAHFVDASFIPKNIKNHWKIDSPKNSKLDELYERVLRESSSDVSDEDLYGRFAHEVVMGGYEARARNHELTGEWIVFSKHDNKNYYLCISRHTSRQEDHGLFDFIKTLYEHEYPHLKIFDED